MSRRLNLGLAALVALMVFAAVYAISRHAVVPDPASCAGRRLEEIRKGDGPVSCRSVRTRS